MIKNRELFNIENNMLKDIFARYSYPHEILNCIHDYILEIGNNLNTSDYTKLKENVWVHKTANIAPGVEIIGPAIVMENSNLRHNAYVRENVIIGPYSVIGNSCEVKNSILISHDEVPHFNYVGDSILGNKVHLGAGVILSNLRLDKQNIQIENVNTNLRKIGAFIGDNTEIGCNSVICPGTIIYPSTIIYPLQIVKGIVKGKNKDIKVERL